MWLCTGWLFTQPIHPSSHGKYRVSICVSLFISVTVPWRLSLTLVMDTLHIWCGLLLASLSRHNSPSSSIFDESKVKCVWTKGLELSRWLLSKMVVFYCEWRTKCSWTLCYSREVGGCNAYLQLNYHNQTPTKGQLSLSLSLFHLVRHQPKMIIKQKKSYWRKLYS